MMAGIDQPIPLSDIEDVLAWVDTFKLSRQTKKINRDFADAVLLAEILAVHYPKLVEMHNYPPRNSQALKLNNWMTLNRKVLKKLRLTLCYNTMEMLANSKPGIIERVLISVRDKIRHDEELNKSTADHETNMSSGGSYYEACGAEDNVLVVPVKTRVNGVLEVIQQKVVNYESFMAMKMELKDAQEAAEMLRQKVEHLDNMIKLKDIRIEELQKQLERKATRRKEIENLTTPFEPSVPSTPIGAYDISDLQSVVKPFTIKSAEQPLEDFPDVKVDALPQLSSFPATLSATNIGTPKVSVHKVDSQPKISVTKIDVKPKSSIPRLEPPKPSSMKKIDKFDTPDQHQQNSSTKVDKFEIPEPVNQISVTKLEQFEMLRRDLEPKTEALTKFASSPQIEAKKSREKSVVSHQIEVIKAASVKSNASTDTAEPSAEVFMTEVDRVKSDLFQELEDEEESPRAEETNEEAGVEKIEIEEFKDSEQEVCYQTITISDSIQKELKGIRNTIGSSEMTYLN